MVSTLIVYCQKLDPGFTSDEANGLVKEEAANATEAPPKNCTIYRKNDEDDVLFAGVNKKNKKSSAKKQKVREK